MEEDQQEVVVSTKFVDQESCEVYEECQQRERKPYPRDNPIGLTIQKFGLDFTVPGTREIIFSRESLDRGGAPNSTGT